MFIFFDLDGTLIDYERAAMTASLRFLSQFADALPYSEKEFPSVWKTLLNRHFEMFIRREISFVEQRRNRMRELFCNPSLSNNEADAIFRAYLLAYESSWSLFDDALACLARFDKQHLGLISNGNLEQQYRKLSQANLIDKFSVIVISEAIGVSKPHPEIFLEACRRAKVEPEEAIYIGDSLDNDALASKSAGMKGVWLNRNRLPISNLPVPVIAKLDEMEGLLAEIE